MYSLNAFWSRPGNADDNPDIQKWHRDRDDTKFLALFMLATSVAIEKQGAHLYAKGTHRHGDTGNHAPRGEPIERITGPAGTCWLADPSGLHVGLKPRMGERLLAWARWGVSYKPRSYGWDQLEPVPASRIGVFLPTQAIAESTSLIVDWAA